MSTTLALRCAAIADFHRPRITSDTLTSSTHHVGQLDPSTATLTARINDASAVTRVLDSRTQLELNSPPVTAAEARPRGPRPEATTGDALTIVHEFERCAVERCDQAATAVVPNFQRHRLSTGDR